MYVTKRNITRQKFKSDKILNRLQNLCYDLDMKYIDIGLITKKVTDGLYDEIKTTEIDNLSAEICASMIVNHYDYGKLAARIAISKLHKETKSEFSEVMKDLHGHGIISDAFYINVLKNIHVWDSLIKHKRDFNFNYFGFKTLEKSYLLKIKDTIVERPQYMFLRVAIAIHKDDLDKILETYKLMSEKYFIHATPTLFNAGTLKPQMSSCFLMTMQGNNVEDIFKTLSQCATISKHSGGIGLAVHNVDNLIPMIRIFNSTVRFMQHYNKKRPGNFAIYLEPWHEEIFEFLNLKKNTGNEEDRARDLFYALWIPDLFMERVENDQMWSLMRPSECKGLSDCWGKTFTQLYTEYEKEKKFKKQIPARKVWRAIINSQIETGNPFVLYKDACNKKSNQAHLGTIQCSNLCTEIIQFSSKNEIAVCNLASIALNKFISHGKFNFKKLKEVTKVITFNLNKLLDANYYPLHQTKESNKKHRPIGIGVQGLADVFYLLQYPFDSVQARDLNIKIFETIYYGALEASCELAAKDGIYESFHESRAAKGRLQFDLWNISPSFNMWDWSILKTKIRNVGLRNSLLIALMPTASTAQILGNHESIEPFTNNIYTRRVLSGEFQIINQYLLKDLIDNGLWNESIKQKIMNNNGSIQNMKEIPDDIKLLYKTVWEIPQKSIIDMAIDRAPFIDQSQSLNIHMTSPTYATLSSMHFYGWKNGLKTGMYYLRSKSAAQPIQFTVDKECLSCTS